MLIIDFLCVLLHTFGHCTVHVTLDAPDVLLEPTVNFETVCLKRGFCVVPLIVLCLPVQVSHRDVETEKRLKKDLKRTKVLLADAQIMLDHLKNNAPSKREISQLKNQVCGYSISLLYQHIKMFPTLSLLPFQTLED